MPPKRPKIIVAPLDWGLGHATRCIPIIYALMASGCEVWIAAEGLQRELLAGEFPQLRMISLPGYRLRYGPNAWLTQLKIILAIPKILIQINRENRWLKDLIGREKPDAIISDNRFGLSARGIVSVFITHQLRIRTPFGALSEKILWKLNRHFIKQFSYCWIPDGLGSHSLSGELSGPDQLTEINKRYIGTLSRFQKCPSSPDSRKLLILLSGPEPQRTILENKLLKQARPAGFSLTLVRGLPGRQELPDFGPEVKVFNHLPGRELNRIICESGMIICRAGYSSIMELMGLSKKCILIPTPGQTEQEYLAEELFGKRLAFRVRQDEFEWKECLDEAGAFPFASYEEEEPGHLEAAIQELLARI